MYSDLQNRVESYMATGPRSCQRCSLKKTYLCYLKTEGVFKSLGTFEPQGYRDNRVHRKCGTHKFDQQLKKHEYGGRTRKQCFCL